MHGFILIIIIFIILKIILTINVEDTKKKMSGTNGILVSIKFLRLIQIIEIIGIVVLIYSITYFIFNEGSLPKKIGIINIPNVTSIVDWGVPILIVLTIFDKILIFVIIDFLIIISKSKFDFVKIIRYIIAISKVYLIRFIVSLGLIAFEKGKISFDFDLLIVYITLLVLAHALSIKVENMGENDNG